MKESDYIKGLAKYLVKKDKHLALNMVQSKQLVQYIREYEDGVGMLPPCIESGYKKWGFNPYRENNYWEDENETNK